MSEYKKLHPISAIINFFKGIREAIFPLIVIVFLNGNFSGGSPNWFSLGISAVVLIGVLLSGIFRWIRFTYRIEEGELRIEYGLIFKKKRYIPIDRIQSLNFSEGIFHRPFELVKVSVETAGGSGGKQKAEAELTAIKRSEADELEAVIFQEKQGHKREPDRTENGQERELVFEMKMKDLLIMAITSGGAGVVLSGVGVFFSQIMDSLPLGMIYEQVKGWLQFGVLVIASAVFSVLLIAYGAAIIMTIFRYANFSVFLDQDDVIITRGLLEKRQMTIPKNRIQGLRIDENLIRQPLGFASLTLISAGGSVKTEAEQQLKLFPLINRRELSKALGRILPDYQIDAHLKRPPRRSLRRYILRKSWLTWILAIAAAVLFWPFGVMALVVPVFFTVLGWLSYLGTGFSLVEKQLTIRNRVFSLRTYVMKKYRIQSAETAQSLFQKHAELKSVRVVMKSGAGGAQAECLYLERTDCDSVMEWYRPDQTQA
ncbi:PH domain-containing protein [Halobacillus salinarum]|uniref:PH domain-containing protein n=1 Tax=Halobacillus salinarum TaxID=2932257 RepID=A0ABY4EHI0_9BACI|nr:PH domain-containing protein [Halobacillus salinarum]UOQ43609.1 PH domain-containing protein [Halobacillus salinarum]